MNNNYQVDEGGKEEEDNENRGEGEEESHDYAPRKTDDEYEDPTMPENQEPEFLQQNLADAGKSRMANRRRTFDVAKDADSEAQSMQGFSGNQMDEKRRQADTIGFNSVPLI